MEEERSKGAVQTHPEISPQTPGSDSQDNMSNIGPQAGSVLHQVAQEASKVAGQPNSFNIYEEEDETQDPTTNSITKIPEQDLQRLPEHYSNFATTLETPTTSLAAIAGDTAMEGDVGYGIVPFSDLEKDQQVLDDNALSWEGATIGGGSVGDSQQNEAPSVVETEQHQIQAFAKLEFDDGEFYMNTYAVEIGRDVYAARQAVDLRARQDTETKFRKRSTSAGGSITSSKVRQRNGQTMTSSVTSESGGAIAVDNYDSEPTRKPRSRKPKSSSSSSQQLSRKSSMLLSNGKTDYNALAMASLVGYDSGVNDFGPHSPMPAPELVPLVPIHPPVLPGGAPSGGKSISRRHISIAYNFEENIFEVKILGRNGGFVDDEWYAQGDVQTLMNGSIIQIGGVGIRFVLPDVAPGETGAEMSMGSDPLSGGKMSFDIAESIEDESDEDVDKDEERGRTGNFKNEKDDEEEDEEEEEKPEVVKIRAKGKKKPEPEPLPVTRRKGPGRPPKNGINSKREQALLARQAREEAKVVADRGSGALPDRGKIKAGKDTKAVKKEPPVQVNGKRKYTKRKRAGGTNDQRGIRESTEQTDSVPPEQSIAAVLPPKPAKEKKPPKPPRSPSPVFDEATLTPEQLTKPPQNYIVLIHEALSNSETGAMALPQIYRSMQRRYPYFKLRATTVGWQSSVRHNLTQNAAFRKIERDGKGWMWGLVPGVSIEREKKRRATPPPVSQQPYYPPGPPSMQYPYSYPGMLPRNGRMPPNPYGMPPGMPPAHLPHGLPPRGPHGFPLPLVNAQSESTYQSPYQSTPPPQQSSAPALQSQQNSNTNCANGHNPYPTSQPPAQASNNNRQTFGPPSISSPAPNQPGTEALTGPSGELISNAHGQDVVQAVARFKSAFIDSMPDRAGAESLVTSAIDRTLGISNSKDSADEAEDPQEMAIMSALATMLSDLSKKTMETKRRASDAIPPASKPSPAPSDRDPASSLPAAASRAAKIAVQSALTNGDAYSRSSTVEKGAAEDKGSVKRPFENGDSDGTTDHGQPEAKRVAFEA
ncbi:MAG: hypothetical protein ALECFALPRED_009230 [Alectoria fallacina]|uniref:Fork-head domain-containing protein n=1 Tax=Alectoria fallacina TaxID=1903189 RepID=A0A8H3J6D7_9LECA|nr:MAG: hypothetical protein ALECFALPRED_009230 [Alectoria fallacina]